MPREAPARPARPLDAPADPYGPTALRPWGSPTCWALRYRSFGAFTNGPIAPSRSYNASLREAKSIPQITLNRRWQATHLTRQRISRSQMSRHPQIEHTGGLSVSGRRQNLLEVHKDVEGILSTRYFLSAMSGTAHTLRRINRKSLSGLTLGENAIQSKRSSRHDP